MLLGDINTTFAFDLLNVLVVLHIGLSQDLRIKSFLFSKLFIMYFDCITPSRNDRNVGQISVEHLPWQTKKNTTENELDRVGLTIVK